MATTMSRTNRVKKFNSDEKAIKQLQKCPMMLLSLGTAFIREKLGTEAKLVKRGIWVYDVREYVKIWEEGK
jgi:hypothetical protein